MFELNSKNIKKILIIITYTILLCFACVKFNLVLKGLGYILNLLKPFLFGSIIVIAARVEFTSLELKIPNFLPLKIFAGTLSKAKILPPQLFNSARKTLKVLPPRKL